MDVAWVPGAFEIPLIASKMAKSGKYDAVICLGAVIRGATSHYDYVCNEVSKGVAQVSCRAIPGHVWCADDGQYRGRRSSAPEARREIRDMSVQPVQLRW